MIRLKITVFGEGAVGKTSLIKRFSERKFENNYLPTIGCQFCVKELELDGTPIELLLWDLAGQDRFKFVRQQFFTGSKGSIAVFDLTRHTSLDRLDAWLADFHKYCGDTPCVLFGNKVDLKENRQVSEEEGKKFAEKAGLHAYFETSALSGEKVQTAFETLAKIVAKQ